MAGKLVAVEISLETCSLLNTLNGRKKESTHLVQSSLIWPRAGISVRRSTSKVTLLSGVCDMSEEKWCRRIVFKENVQSVFGLGVDLTEPLGSEVAEEFLRFMAGVFLNTGSEIVEDISPFGNIAAAPVKYIAGKIKKMPEPKLIASGMIDLSTDDIPVKGIKRVTVSLNASRNVVKRSRRTINKKTKVTTKMLLKKGAANGELTFAIKRI